MEKRALGKGLSALIPEKSFLELTEDEKKSLVNIPIDTIAGHWLQPRMNYDEDTLAQLKESIQKQGLLQPIVVRVKGQGYEVVAGERRLRACKELGWETIPAIIREVSDEEAFVLALIENIQRENLSAIEEARAYLKMREDFGYSNDQIGQMVGRDPGTVSNLIRLLKLPSDLQQWVDEGRLSMGHARALLALSDENQQRALAEKVIAEGLSVRQIEQIVSGRTGVHKRLKIKRDNGQIVDHDTLLLEEKLQKRLGTKVRIVAGRKRGKIIIEYYDLSDLDRILQLLKIQ